MNKNLDLSIPFSLRVNGIEDFSVLDPADVHLLWSTPEGMFGENYALKLRRTDWSGKTHEETLEGIDRKDQLEVPFPWNAFPAQAGDLIHWQIRLDQGKWSLPHSFALTPKTLAPAHWIGGSGYVFCRKEFEISSEEKTFLWIAAEPHSYARKEWEKMDTSGEETDSWQFGGNHVKYRIWLNGQFVSIGFCRGRFGKSVIEVLDITPYLQEGKNVLAILSLGESRGFAASVQGVESGMIFHTDKSWKTLCGERAFPSVAWNRPGMNHFFKGFIGPGERTEHQQHKHYPQGWQTLGFSDSAWENANLFGLAEGPFEAASMPLLKHVLLKPELHHQKDRTFFDFKQQVFGSLHVSWDEELSSDISDKNKEMEIRLGEECLENGRVRYVWRTQNCMQELWYSATPPAEMEHFGLRPFRYGELLPAQPHARIRLRNALYPFNHQASAFSCDNADLERIWQFCKTTIQATNADVYTDCLSRERQAYEADAYVSMLSHFALDNDFTLARRTLNHLMHHPTWPQEWQLLMPTILWEEYRHTGNPTLWKRYYQSLLHRTLHCADWQEDLAIRFHETVIIDWPPVLRDDYDFEGDFLAVPNAYLYEALLRLSDAARLLQHFDEAEELTQKARRLRRAFHARLYDAEQGLYRDHPFSDHCSFHANIAAIRFELVEPSDAKRILSSLSDKKFPCSPFFAQLFLEALFMHGFSEAACERMLESKNHHGWLMMMDAHAASTTMEVWNPELKKNLSFAHPWATAPVNIISRWMAGIQPLEPGWATISIKPQLGSLQYLRLQLPTPRGPILIEIKKENNLEKIVQCHLPEGMKIASFQEQEPILV